VIALLPACQSKGEAGDGQEAAAGKAESDQAPVAAASEAGEIVEAEAGTAAEPDPAGETGEDETGEDQADQPELPDSFAKVGVEICDQYVTDYLACITDKVPEAEREAQRRAVFDNVSVWTQTAAGGKGAEKGLQTACRIAREQAKRATQDWGCEW
jgi:hypothetical protein